MFGPFGFDPSSIFLYFGKITSSEKRLREKEKF